MSAFRISSSVTGGPNNLAIFQQCDSHREFVGVRALFMSASAGAFERMSDISGDGDVTPKPALISDDKVLSIAQVTKMFNNFILDKEAPLPETTQNFLRNLGFRRVNKLLVFLVDNCQVGLITEKVLQRLRDYPQIFTITDKIVKFADDLNSYESRSAAMAGVLLDMKDQDAFVTLKGWRNECFEVRINMEELSLFKMERAATCLFGIRQFGVDISGYVHHPEKGLCIWLQKRSETKQRWPGMWDNMVGGGLAVGHTILETAHKEAAEEASIPKHLLRNLKPAGSVSIFFESERGLSPNTEFVYDLELPLNFVPKNQDGEVSEFQLLTAKDALKMVLSSSFKTTSCPVALDFLIRHGVLTKEIEPELDLVKQLLRIPLTNFYSNLANRD